MYLFFLPPPTHHLPPAIFIHHLNIFEHTHTHCIQINTARVPAAGHAAAVGHTLILYRICEQILRTYAQIAHCFHQHTQEYIAHRKMTCVSNGFFFWKKKTTESNAINCWICVVCWSPRRH